MKLPITISFDKFVSLTEIMFDSNYWLVINTNFGIFLNYDASWEWWHENKKSKPKVTITSIEVRLPQFSIWDTVMIVDTGEIGIILKESFWDSVVLEDWTYIDSISKLVKIPSDLLPLLQD